MTRVQASVFTKRAAWPSIVVRNFDPEGSIYTRGRLDVSDKLHLDTSLMNMIEPAERPNILDLSSSGVVRKAYVYSGDESLDQEVKTISQRKLKKIEKERKSNKNTEVVPPASEVHFNDADKEHPMTEDKRANAETNAESAQSAEKKPVLVYVPFEDRSEAKALGLKWDKKLTSWYIPPETASEAAEEILKRFQPQTAEEAAGRAAATRAAPEYASYRDQRAERAKAREAKRAAEAAPQEPKAEEQKTQESGKSRSSFLARKIPSYARLYLKPMMYNDEQRDALKSFGAVFDGDHKRWCIDRGNKRAMRALSRVIPDYRVVPFAEKDEAKELGAKWDFTQKAWYVPEGVDASQFARWSRLQDLPCRDYISVPKAEQDEAEQLGALYDQLAKSYYIPKGEDRAAFAKWSPSETEAVASRPDATAFEKARAEERRQSREESEVQRHTEAEAHGSARTLRRGR